MGSHMPLVGVELRKALRLNLWFWVALGAGTGLALLSALQSGVVFRDTLKLALEYWDVSDALYSAASCFAFWLPVDTYDFAPGIFVMVWPLLASIPYAWSWCSERESGLLDQQFARAGRPACYAGKTLATFASGALAVGVPLLVNLVACACFAPASPVWVSDILYVGVGADAPLSSLFYTNPLAFCLAWTLVVCLVAGLWATTIAAVSMLVGNFLQTFVVTYLFLHTLAFVGGQLKTLLMGQLTDEALRSALLTLDVFRVVSVRTQPDSTLALLAVIAVLLGLSAALPTLLLKRDLL